MAKTVFTNGCFDILHAGHVDLLERAAALGDRLIVGINSDDSVSRIKGPSRPVNDQESRKRILLGLKAVDEVVIFDEPTPERIIHELKPHVLVKGGDWSPAEIIGGDFVLRLGGEVVSLPLVPGHSTTGLVEKLSNPSTVRLNDNDMSIAKESIEEHLKVFSSLATECIGAIERSAAIIVTALRNGNKVMTCGNGGSAGDAQHIAAELVGRFESERMALPALALTTDTSALTAIANDYGYEQIFSRQVEGLGRNGDVLICISTSGNSPNVIAAAMRAREIGCTTICLTGASGKKLASVCDEAVLVPSSRTARIQEAHIAVGHMWCEAVDREMGGTK